MSPRDCKIKTRNFLPGGLARYVCKNMCPLRFILVFFSAVLAGYFAWRTVHSSPDTSLASDGSAADNDESSPKKQDFNFKKMIQDGFWVFVEMASGRYLWRNLRATNKDVEVKSS